MTQTERRAIGDMKQGLTGAKPKLSILPRAMLDHGARPIEYGADKYARGNYHGPPPAALGEHAAGLRVLGYVDAAIRHLTRVSNAMNRALGTGGDVRAACATVDDDATGGFPPSGLPDLSHALASVGLGITCAVDDGLLPADPGRPWDALRPPVELPQKADPDAERRRVESLGRRTGDIAATGRPPFTYTQAEIDAAKAAALPLVPAPTYAYSEVRPVAGLPFEASDKGPSYPYSLEPLAAKGPRFVVVPADEVGDRPAEFFHSKELCDEFAGKYNRGESVEHFSPSDYPRLPKDRYAIVETQPKDQP